MSLQILPLAITMMAGPQILSATILVTTPKLVKVSVPFIAGVAISATGGVLIALAVAVLLGNSLSLGEPSDSRLIGNLIQYLVVGLLIVLSVRSYLGRGTSEPPSWLGTLQNADRKLAPKTGLLLILLMPSDVIIMLTVGFTLAQNDAGLVAALPFVAATALVAALPLLLYLLFRRRAQWLMPKVRNWVSRRPERDALDEIPKRTVVGA